VVVGRVELGEEPAGGGHHVDLVADPELLQGVLGERTAGEPLHRDPQRPGGDRRADRVVASDVVAGELGAHRDVLPLGEGVVLPQLLGHVEGDRDRVVGQRLDRGDRQGVEDSMAAAHEAGS
jgi:hypothetical protein